MSMTWQSVRYDFKVLCHSDVIFLTAKYELRWCGKTESGAVDK